MKFKICLVIIIQALIFATNANSDERFLAETFVHHQKRVEDLDKYFGKSHEEKVREEAIQEQSTWRARQSQRSRQAINEKQQEFLILTCLLSLFGGFLLAILYMLCIYCIRESKVRETPQQQVMREKGNNFEHAYQNIFHQNNTDIEGAVKNLESLNTERTRSPEQYNGSPDQVEIRDIQIQGNTEINPYKKTRVWTMAGMRETVQDPNQMGVSGPNLNNADSVGQSKQSSQVSNSVQTPKFSMQQKYAGAQPVSEFAAKPILEVKEDMDESRISQAGGEDGLEGVLEMATEENNVTGAEQVEPVAAVDQNADSETMGNIGADPNMQFGNGQAVDLERLPDQQPEEQQPEELKTQGYQEAPEDQEQQVPPRESYKESTRESVRIERAKLQEQREAGERYAKMLEEQKAAAGN